MLHPAGSTGKQPHTELIKMYLFLLTKQLFECSSYKIKELQPMFINKGKALLSASLLQSSSVSHDPSEIIVETVMHFFRIVFK